MNKISRSLLIIALALLCANAHATWSIIAVDQETGEIGIAGASCTFDVQGIASIVPGKGAIVVQAASNYFARMTGVDAMEEDASASQVLAAMKDEKFEPERQQYGVITLSNSGSPLVYSGSQINDWSGSRQDSDFAVLGNILVGESVISETYKQFNDNREKSLTMRLMIALEAGANAGGDSRCGDQHARSAFLSVYDPETKAINKISVHGLELGGHSAIRLLRKKVTEQH